MLKHLAKATSTAVFAALLLSACASYVMKGYVGENINEAILDYGPYANVIELEDGKRAYQWARGHSVTPPPAPNLTSAAGNLDGVSTIENTRTNLSGYTTAGTCFYTLIAEKKGEDWIVTDYRKPNIECQ